MQRFTLLRRRIFVLSGAGIQHGLCHLTCKATEDGDRISQFHVVSFLVADGMSGQRPELAL